MFSLPSIAWATKSLSIGLLGFASGCHAYDVVQLQAFGGSAARAATAQPFPQLGRVEPYATRDAASRALGQGHHRVVMNWQPPISPHGVGLSAPRFAGMARQQNQSIGSGLPMAGHGAKTHGAVTLGSPLDEGRPLLKGAPARLARQGDLPLVDALDAARRSGSAEALHGAEADFPALGLSRAVESGRALEYSGAYFAGGDDLRNGLWHVSPFQLNSGEFGEPQRQSDGTVYYSISRMLAIPSQAAHVAAKAVSGTEGVTTRGCGNNKTPTSARRHSIGEEIVWADASNWHERQKQLVNSTAVTQPTFTRYSGYDILNISPSDVMTAAQYSFTQAAVAVTINGLEELQNAGAERVIDLLESRIGNAEKTMMNNISSDCYSNGTADGGKQIGGLQLLVADVNNSGSVGGIDSGTWGFWQNYVASFASNSLTPGASTIQSMMNTVWLNIARGRDHPDLWIADNIYFGYFWSSLQAIQRINSSDKGVPGFRSLAFMDADVVYDGGFQGNTTGNVSTGSPLGAGGSWTSGTGAPASHMYALSEAVHYAH